MGLMQAIERWARERAAVRAMLDTYAASPLSVPFYERGMGYRRRSIGFEKRLVQRADGRPGGSPPASTGPDASASLRISWLGAGAQPAAWAQIMT